MDVPPCVTRFYGNAEFVLDVVEKQQIAFIHTSLLNDPFDPYFFVETDFGDNYNGLIRHVREHHPADLGWFRTHVTPKSWITTLRELKAYFEKLRRATFVLSMSVAAPELHPRDNLYMWGHYGNGHRGVAIEFDASALANAVMAQQALVGGELTEETEVWARMEYAQGFSPIAAEDVYEFMKMERDVMERRVAERVQTRLESYYNRMSTVKSAVWHSENEWRLMWRSDGTIETIYKCPISANCVTAIYLGLNLPRGAQDRIVLAARAKFPAARIMKASKRPGDLALDFRQF